MAAQAELAFAKTFLNTLSSQPVTYPDDYQQPPENSLKKVPVLPIPLPSPPQRMQEENASTSSLISVLFKSAKPPASYTISVQPTDPISSIKAQLASVPSAPPADAQRLLLKGKALADSKLLKEYNIKDGDIVNLMIKPGFNWDPNSTTPQPTLAPPMSPSLTLNVASPTPQPPRKHQRIPSVVLSPSPSHESPQGADRPLDIPLDLDIDSTPSPLEDVTAYHTTLANPDFWERMYSILKAEFPTERDALLAFEDFLAASKNTLTAHEIAKIRDHVGVAGMAGT